jgi:uncharacterized membrane protein|tara:strand:+ start:897 stop:1532 length:636 start_codon:yes stop_codon:yes gene_type:complete
MDYFITHVLFRFGHILVGITWIGLLYYFNFIQTEYFKEAEPDAKSDVLKKLAPKALWWFRWAAAFTFLTGLYLLYGLQANVTNEIILGSLMGTIMMLNVWGIIWRNQKIVIGIKEGDAVLAGTKAALASRTNTLLSVPMLYFMVYSAHGLPKDYLMTSYANTGFLIIIASILLIEANAIFGKMHSSIASVRGVITSSFVLTFIFSGLAFYL